MKLVVGLGNPEEKYANSRHNVGFVVLDSLASRLGYPGFDKSSRFKSDVIIDRDIILAKPRTYMNSSGVAAKALSNFFKIRPGDIYVVHDDLDIVLGEYKIQLGVGPRLHNGVSSTEEKLGEKDFWRVRVGIDNREVDNRIIGEDYVLQQFTDKEQKKLQEVIQKLVSELVVTLTRS